MAITNYNLANATSQMRKGLLEFPVLLIIGSEKAYTSEILKKLKDSNLLVVEGTLYPLLSRLKNQGLIDYDWKESKTGPPRKYYSLTPYGAEIVASLKQSWQSLAESITTLTHNHETSN